MGSERTRQTERDRQREREKSIRSRGDYFKVISEFRSCVLSCMTGCVSAVACVGVEAFGSQMELFLNISFAHKVVTL